MATIFATESDPVHSSIRFKNRNRMEIVANLLNIARTETLKTHLMYRANLSYVMITEYLDYLKEAGLIEETFDSGGASKLYKTSEKGLKYLEVYTSLQNIAGMNVRKTPRADKEIVH